MRIQKTKENVLLDYISKSGLFTIPNNLLPLFVNVLCVFQKYTPIITVILKQANP